MVIEVVASGCEVEGGLKPLPKAVLHDCRCCTRLEVGGGLKPFVVVYCSQVLAMLHPAVRVGGGLKLISLPIGRWRHKLHPALKSGEG